MALALLLVSTCQAAFELEALGARAAGMGGAGVALGGDPWSPARNPALVGGESSGLGVVWSQEFELPELAREAGIAGFAVSGQPVAVRAGNFGSPLYRETELALHAARGMGRTVALGVALEGRALEIEGVRAARTVAISIGAVGEPVRGVRLGGVWRNVNEPRIPGYEDHIAESLTLGLAATPAAGVWVAADIVQELHFPAEYRFGAEARVLPTLRLRVGTRAEPFRPSAGFQMDLGRWGFTYAADLHPDLGVSHEIGLDIRLRK